jgi:hypothetical protein
MRAGYEFPASQGYEFPLNSELENSFFVRLYVRAGYEPRFVRLYVRAGYEPRYGLFG